MKTCLLALTLVAAGLAAPQKGVSRSSLITFTLARREEKCFKQDLIEGQLLDIYYELFGELKAKPTKDTHESSILSSTRTPIGIYMQIYDPTGQPFAQPVLLASAKPDDQYAREGDTRDHQHRSYHKKARVSGMHRVCIRGHKSLYKEVPGIKYEMSIQLDGLFEAQYEQREEGEMGTVPKDMVTKENFDRVDLLMGQMESKAEAIIADQAYQRDVQRGHQEQQEQFSSNFVLYVSIQIVFLIGTVLWQVLNLREFFVQKNIH